MTIEKAHRCSDHVVVLKQGTGKPRFAWSAASDEIVIAWNCDYPFLACLGTSSQQSSSALSEKRDYAWDLKMDSSEVSMWVDGAKMFSCPTPSWYASPYYI